MRLTRLDQKLMAGIVGLFLIPTVLAAGALIVLYRWRAFDDAFTLLVTVVVGLATLMGYLGLIAHTVGQSLVRAIREIQLGTELVATVNPAHRLAVTTGDELQLLAEEINHLAARLEAAGQDRGRAAADATAALDSERTRLARIVDALGEGVVVVTSAGRVSLANRAAHALLGQCRVGADLLEVFDDTSAVARSADRFRAGAASVEHFALRTKNGRVLEAVTTALVEKEGFAGLVIVLRDRAMERAPSPGDAPAPRAAGGASVTATLGLASRDEGLAPFDFSLFDDMDRHVTLSDRSRPLDQLACTVLDAETTGLEPSRGDRIVSIACVRVRNGAVRRAELIDVLVNPERPIPPENARIHGITDGMVAGAPVIDAIVPAVLRFADGTVLVGHHVWFDLMFLRETTERLGVPPLTRSHPVLDTSLLSQFLHGPLGRHDLETVAARLGVPTQGRHSARGDAVMTAEILVRLFKILRKRGIGTLGEALDATRRMQARFIAVTGAP